MKMEGGEIERRLTKATVFAILFSMLSGGGGRPSRLHPSIPMSVATKPGWMAVAIQLGLAACTALWTSVQPLTGFWDLVRES
jgi:hypothetical protein